MACDVSSMAQSSAGRGGTVTYDGLHVAELEIARDEDGLDQKLVTALSVGRGILLHGLEEDYRRALVSSWTRADICNEDTNR